MKNLLLLLCFGVTSLFFSSSAMADEVMIINCHYIKGGEIKNIFHQNPDKQFVKLFVKKDEDSDFKPNLLTVFHRLYIPEGAHVFVETVGRSKIVYDDLHPSYFYAIDWSYEKERLLVYNKGKLKEGKIRILCGDYTVTFS